MGTDEHDVGDRSADVLTHSELVEQGALLADSLARCGVTSGSRVAVLLPMCLESVVVTLACLRLEAVRITLPLGDHSGWVRHRIRSSGARVVIAADHYAGEAAELPVKAALDQALAGCPEVHTVLVVPQLPRPVPWQPGRDRWWREFLARPRGRPGAPYAGHMTSDNAGHGPDAPVSAPSAADAAHAVADGEAGRSRGDAVVGSPTAAGRAERDTDRLEGGQPQVVGPTTRPGGVSPRVSSRASAAPGGVSAAPSGGPALVFDDPLALRAADDRDEGWGERAPASGGDLARFLDERPPHHG